MSKTIEELAAEWFDKREAYEDTKRVRPAAEYEERKAQSVKRTMAWVELQVVESRLEGAMKDLAWAAQKD